jgi:hypothetical protein
MEMKHCVDLRIAAHHDSLYKYISVGPKLPDCRPDCSLRAVGGSSPHPLLIHGCSGHHARSTLPTPHAADSEGWSVHTWRYAMLRPR